MLRYILVAAVCLAASLVVVRAASAEVRQFVVTEVAREQTAPAAPSFLAGRRDAQQQQQTAGPPGFLQRAYSWLLFQQQRINRELANAVKALKAQGSAAAASMLAALGFMYGVLHAAGPGHGKAVISSYVLANEKTVRRGIMLSFLAAVFQALSAIAIVGILAIALNATSLAMRSAEHWIEIASWGFVALVGAWLLAGQIRQIGIFARAARDDRSGVEGHGHPSCTCTHHDGHNHGHHGAHDHGAHDHGGHDHGGHAHSAHEACCDHAHMPDPRELGGDLTMAKALAIALSVGIRPCTGAILVLVFALSQGLFWAGILATFAMALGTAITVSALASLAVGSREFAVRMGGADSRWATRVSMAAGLLGSALVLVMGSVFFIGALQGPAPL